MLFSRPDLDPREKLSPDTGSRPPILSWKFSTYFMMIFNEKLLPQSRLSSLFLFITFLHTFVSTNGICIQDLGTKSRKICKTRSGSWQIKQDLTWSKSGSETLIDRDKIFIDIAGRIICESLFSKHVHFYYYWKRERATVNLEEDEKGAPFFEETMWSSSIKVFKLAGHLIIKVLLREK